MQKRKKRGHNWFAYILGIVVLICLGIIAQQEYKIYQLKQEKAATEARIDALTEKHANLEAERKKLDDPKYLEKLAREDYNMVGKNEVRSGRAHV